MGMGEGSMKKLLDNMRHTDSYRDAKSTLLNGRNAVICGMPLALNSLCVATLYQDCSGAVSYTHLVGGIYLFIFIIRLNKILCYGSRYMIREGADIP